MSGLLRILILGNSGFIGSHLERHLASSCGSLEVLGFSRNQVDLSSAESVASLRPLLGLGTAIVLCAAKKRQYGDTLEAYHQNMAIVENLATLIAEEPVRRLLFLSSAAVYGEETHNLAISEDTLPNPTSFYGIAKYTSECLLGKMLAGTPTGIADLRSANIYGPGDKGKTYGPVGFYEAARKGQPITLWGDGTEMREFIYIDDLCRIVEVLLGHSFTGPVNIASGQRYSFLHVIEALRELGLHPDVNTRPRTKKKADNAFMPDLLKSLIPEDFRFTPLTEGMSRMMEAPV